MNSIRIFIFSSLCLSNVNNLQAQQFQVGRVLVAKSKTTVKTVIQMQPGMEMEVPIKGENTTEIAISSVADQVVQGTVELKKIKGSVTMMGQEQSFDSDDNTSLSNPLVQNMLKSLSTKVPFILKKGVSDAKLTTTELVQSNGNDIVWKLTLPTTQLATLKENNQWIDTIAEKETGSSVITNYNVTKIGNQEVWVDGIAEVKFNNTIEQMGMQMKQHLIGTISFKRIYNEKGVLKSETRSTNLSGKMDAMGQQMPVKMIGNLETTIE